MMTLPKLRAAGLLVFTGVVASIVAPAVAPAVAQVPMGWVAVATAQTPLTTITATTSTQPLAFASIGNVAYDITLTANTSFTLTGATAGQFQSMTLLLREGSSGGYVPSLPSSIQWASGAPPSFSTVAGAVNTVVLSTSDGGKTITGLAGGVPIGTASGTARDAAAGIAAEQAAAAAAAAESTRAQAAEAALLPKSGTTMAGLSVAGSPSAAQIAAALPAFSSTAQGLVPPPPNGGSNMVLGQNGWTTTSGGGNVSTDTGGSISAQVVHAAAGAVNRTLSARASDTFNARDYGALGNGNATAIGTTYGSTLAALASYTTSAGATPFSWATNPLFGLTFTMTTTSAQSGAGTTLNFAYPLSSGWAATVAPWQDPATGNYLLRTGMLVSGSCIASGTTVSAIPSTIVRQGELLPGATDWAANTAYAVNAEVFANGNFYKATTAGTSGSSGGPTSTGTGISDGSVAWSYLKPSEYTNLPSGAVTLSAATSSACPNGSTITFTIAPAQLQALTLDWLGIQAAIAQAYFNPAGGGGEAYIPAGVYSLNHSLMNPGGSGSNTFQSVSVVGDGEKVSQLQWIVDLGQDECAIGEANRSQSLVNANRYEDFSIIGLGGYTSSLGVSPRKMDGLCMGEADSAYRIFVTNVHGGFSIERDHQVLRDNATSSVGYGLYFQPYSSTIGNQEVNGGAMFGLIASVGISSTNQMDSSLMANVHSGFGPYGFYSMPSTPNVTQTDGAAVTNNVIDGVWTESVGAAWMKGSQPYSNFNTNIIIAVSSGMVNNSNYSISNGAGGTVQPRAEIDVTNFIGNTMVGTQMAPYGVVSTAAILASATCSSNHWDNDPFFVLGISGSSIVPSASVPMMQCAYGGGNDVTLASAHYNLNVVYSYGANLFASNAGVPVYPTGNSGGILAPYIDGQMAVGVTSITCHEGFGYFCPVQTSGFATIKGNGSQINPGPVMPSAMGFNGVPGVVQALDATNALGTTLSSCTTSCYVQLGNMGGGQSVAMGQTAGTSGSPFAITTRVTQFTSVGSGGAATLPTAGAPGDMVTVYNDGANALTLSIPSSGTFLPGGGATTTLPAGSSGTYRRVNNTQWH